MRRYLIASKMLVTLLPTIVATLCATPSPSSAASRAKSKTRTCSQIFAEAKVTESAKTVSQTFAPKEQIQDLNDLVSSYRGVFGARTVGGVPTIYVSSVGRAQALNDLPYALPVDGGNANISIYTRGIKGQAPKGKLIETYKEAKNHVADFKTELQKHPEFEFWFRGSAPMASTGGQFAIHVRVADPDIAAEIPRTFRGYSVIVDIVEDTTLSPRIEIDYTEASLTVARAREHFQAWDGFIDARVMLVPPEGLGAYRHFENHHGYYLELLFEYPPIQEIAEHFEQLFTVVNSDPPPTLH